MRKTRQKSHEKGITLIALVVTIVVLLILAGVSINLVIGNNGLIAKAKEAKNKTEQDAVNTETALDNLYGEMLGALGENGGGSGSSIDLSQLNIGDYVNYTYDTVENYTDLTGTGSSSNPSAGIAQSTTTLQWRILNIDEENSTIDLVSATPTDNTVYFSGALGYNNGVYLLNDMCASLYSNSSLGITARSINLVDMEKHLTTAGFNARNAYTEEVRYGSTFEYTGGYYPNLYANQLGAGIDLAEDENATQPSDMTVPDPYNESSSYYSIPTTETYTNASTSLTVTQTYYNIAINEINYGEAASILSQSNSYWVASRFTSTGSAGIACFGLSYVDANRDGNYMFDSNFVRTYNYDGRLRPVVSLPSSLLDGTKDESGAWNLKTSQN